MDIKALELDSLRRKGTIDEILRGYGELDSLLKKYMMEFPAQNSQSAYSKARELWLEATDGLLDFCDNQGKYIVPDDREALTDFLDLAFFAPEKLLNVTQPEKITPAISVIFPIYKSWPYVLDALRSVLDQSYGDFEVIIVDEYKNTDPTENIVRFFGDSRVRIVKKTIEGKLGVTRNLGLENARGEFIACMDSDDISINNRFEKQVNFFRENPDISICGAQMKKFQNSRALSHFPTQHTEIQAQFFTSCAIVQSTVMWRNEIFKSRNLWYDTNADAEDYLLFCQASWQVKCANLDEVLLRCRWHGKNKSTNEFMNYSREQREFNEYMRNCLRLKLGRQRDLTDQEIEIYFKEQGVDMTPSAFDQENRFRITDKNRNTREYVIWGYGFNGHMLEAFLKEKAMAYRIADAHIEKKGLLSQIPNSIEIDKLRANSHKYYVLVSLESPPAEIGDTLIRYGYELEKDFFNFYMKED